MGLARGVADRRHPVRSDRSRAGPPAGGQRRLTITRCEGKNREVRNVMESKGLTVNRLIRVAYGPFQLGKLERGEVEEVPKRVLHDQVAKFFADRGDKPEAPNTGTAKAKPRPKPRHTSAAHAAKPTGVGVAKRQWPRGAGRVADGQRVEGQQEKEPDIGRPYTGRQA